MNPINLDDEADENTAPLPASYCRLEKVYGGTIHDDDDGTHLQGGILNDSLWQGYAPSQEEKKQEHG